MADSLNRPPGETAIGIPIAYPAISNADPTQAPGLCYMRPSGHFGAIEERVPSGPDVENTGIAGHLRIDEETADPMSDFFQKRTEPPLLASLALSLVVLGGLTALTYGIGWLQNILYIDNPVMVTTPAGRSIDFDHKAWLLGLPGFVVLPLPALLISLVLWLAGVDLTKLFIGSSKYDQQGSARFATASEKRKFHKRETASLIVGGRDGGAEYYFDGPEHLLTIAPTRSGKGVGAIIPNLLTVQRSVICIDPKGENAQITARRREEFGPVHVLDPFDVSGRHNCTYNPLAGLTPDHPDFVDDAASLASALIVTSPNAREPHFEEAARALLRGFIMQVVTAEPAHRRNLVTAREYLTYPQKDFRVLLKTMSESREAHGVIASTANVFLGKNEREAASILSTAQEQTNFLDSPQLRRTLQTSDMNFASLKDRTASVYIVLPQSRLESHGRWIRLLIARALQDMERNRAKPPAPVLFILDEFPTIGDLPVIKTAIGLMAGYGLQIWAFLQNWGQLEELYQKGVGTRFA